MMKWTIGLDIYTHIPTMFRPMALNNKSVIKDIEEKKYHIYLICKRKKMYYDSFDPKEKVAKFYTLDDNHDKYYSLYHNKHIVINDFNNGIVDITFKGHNLKVADFILLNNYHFIEGDEVGDSIKEKLPSDLEVMYVGQAFGRKENKNIDYRLKNHEKIQKVALEILDQGTNEDLLIIGVSIKAHDLSFSVFDGDKKISPTKDELNELIQKAKKRPSEGQIVTLFEASLIRYFQPEYNDRYKLTFPSPDFSSCNEIYDMDFDFFSFVLDTETIFCRLFSDNCTYKYKHHKYFIIGENSKELELIDYIEENNDTT